MMLQAKSHEVLQDADYARFAHFYLANSEEFDEQYMLHDALLHLISTLLHSRLLLLDDEQGRLGGFGQYRYTEDRQTAFIDSVMLAKPHRSSRVFFAGFRDLVLQICQENDEIQTLQFHAVANNRYINRLYSKFSTHTDTQERNGRTEHVYTAELDSLLVYLKIKTAV
ncbi:GNAT family N-acetyltransferase [Paenibacillus sp. FSL R5-0623]|uniref:GNAT family N-acetyltransferase n=1 Tax=Paenibacillus sp. FSL R5-0623 TaxID=2921651 RepID=UPI0030D77959